MNRYPFFSSSIRRYCLPLCTLDSLGKRETLSHLQARAFRPDKIITNVTQPHQVFLQQLFIAGRPQFVGGDIDAYSFSPTAEKEMRDAWFRKRGITEEEWFARAIAREEAGVVEEEEDAPPEHARLELPSMTRGDEIRIITNCVSPIGEVNIILLGYAQE
jgi:hypothetical protein